MNDEPIPRVTSETTDEIIVEVADRILALFDIHDIPHVTREVLIERLIAQRNKQQKES